MPEQIGAWGGPGDRTESALMNIDFANHPALQSAMRAFESSSQPMIANQMAAAGLSRSGAAGQALTSGRQAMALPVIQNLMGLSVQERGQDIGERAGDIQAGLQGRGQDIGMRAGDINAMLAGRGQDVSQRGQDIQGALQNLGLGLQARGQDIGALLTGRGQDLGARGQDINALLAQGSQGLQARGQDIGAQQASMQGLLGLSGQELARYQAAMGAATGMGGLGRDISQQQADAPYDESQRRANMAMQLLMGPLGGLGQQVGSRTTTQQGK
jgi:hypothetical protein